MKTVDDRYSTQKLKSSSEHTIYVLNKAMAKITSIEYFRVLPRWLFVKICDEKGNVGWGEATLEGHTQAVEGCLDALRGRILGYEAE